MQFDEQAQQAPCEPRIDVAGRLVGEKKLGADDERARDRRALLLAAGKHRGDRVHRWPEADPAEKFDHLRPVARFLRPSARNGSATFS